MSDLNCQFDMPQGIPLKEFNILCEVNEQRSLLGLRGRFEAEEITPEFTEELLKLSPAEQKQVMRRFTDKAIAHLRKHAQSYPAGSPKRKNLDNLVHIYLSPMTRIMPDARSFVVQQQSDLQVNSEEWGDDILRAMEYFYSRAAVAGPSY